MLAGAAGAQTLPTATPFPFATVPFLDTAGRPLAGGKICTYAAGTTTPQATYTDSTAGTANDNPIILNSAGLPQKSGSVVGIYGNGPLYKIVVRTAGSDPSCNTGVVLFTNDNVGDITLFFANYVKTVGTTGLLTYTAPPAGAVSETLTTRLGYELYVKDFGAKGDGSTDDTAAIQAAITASLSGTYSFPPCIHFTQGTYKITSGFHITQRNACIVGDSPWTTSIDGNFSGIILNLDTFNATANPPWTGNANNFVLRNITLENSAQLDYTLTGSRITTGLQNNGSSHMLVENVQVQGLKGGIIAPYGSDFDRLRQIWADWNDVGVYLGPSSNQFSIIALQAGQNGDGLVLDGAGQGTVFASTFGDGMTSNITTERQQPTRYGYTGSGGNHFNSDSTYVISGNWFESGAGFTLATWQEYRQILSQSNVDNSYPRNIIVEHNFWIAGNGGLPAKDASVHSFLEMKQGRFWQMNDLTIAGDRRDTEIYNTAGNSTALTARNVVVDDGYNASLPIFTFGGGSATANAWTYTPQYLLLGNSIPASCWEGSPSFFYYTTNTNWYGCGSGGNYVPFAQLDGTFHLPMALIPIDPTFTDTITVNSAAQQATLNAVSTTIQGGTAGKWWVQNGGSPVSSFNLQGYNPAGTATIVLQPGGAMGGAASIGTMSLGGILLNGTTFANLGTPGPGSLIWCSDCTIASNPCTGGGLGTFAMRLGSAAWKCF